LRQDVGKAFAQGKEGEESGWEFGGPMAGHLIGQFPHERIPEDKVSLYIHPNNHAPNRQTGNDRLIRHWILEIHFVDRTKQIGSSISARPGMTTGGRTMIET
jgi:hypothetical protein